MKRAKLIMIALRWCALGPLLGGCTAAHRPRPEPATACFALEISLSVSPDLILQTTPGGNCMQLELRERTTSEPSVHRGVDSLGDFRVAAINLAATPCDGLEYYVFAPSLDMQMREGTGLVEANLMPDGNTVSVSAHFSATFSPHDSPETEVTDTMDVELDYELEGLARCVMVED